MLRRFRYWRTDVWSVLLGLVLVGLVTGCGSATATPTRPPTLTATPTRPATQPTATATAAPQPTVQPTGAATPTRQPTAQATATLVPTAAPTATKAVTAVVTPTATTPPIQTATKTGGILRMASWGDPPGWDPVLTGGLRTANPSIPITGDDNLVRRCREDVFKLCPALATTWDTSADGLAWTFHLRDNVFWHDGTPFTAEDAKWFFDFVRNGVTGRPPAPWASSLFAVKSIDVVDPKTLRFTLSTPQVRFLFELIPQAGTSVLEYPRHLMQPEIAKGNATVSPDQVGHVGLGPFKFLDYTKGSQIRIRRFDKYWEKDANGKPLPYLDGIDFPLSTDASVILAGFRAGRLDVTAPLGWVKPDQRKILTSELGDNVYFHLPEAYPDYLDFNTTVAPFNDVRVRQAINLWYDRQALISTIWGGDASARALFPFSTPYANKDLLTRPGFNPATKQADRAKAKQMLADAGFPNGFKVTVLTRDFYQDRSEYTVSDLSGLLGAGNVTMQVLDTATFNARRRTVDWAVIHDSPGLQMDPEQTYPGWKAKADGGQTIHTDTKVDDYFQRLANMDEGPARYALAQELERYVMQEQVYGVGLTTYIGGIAYRSYVKGVPLIPMCVLCSIDKATLWLDK